MKEKTILAIVVILICSIGFSQAYEPGLIELAYPDDDMIYEHEIIGNGVYSVRRTINSKCELCHKKIIIKEEEDNEYWGGRTYISNGFTTGERLKLKHELILCDSCYYKHSSDIKKRMDEAWHKVKELKINEEIENRRKQEKINKNERVSEIEKRIKYLEDELKKLKDTTAKEVLKEEINRLKIKE